MKKINLAFNAIEYKGFVGKVTYDDISGILDGEIINSPDHINFQGESVSELRQALINAVDTYLEECKKNHREPQILSFSGKFIVRLDPELHRSIATLARIDGVSINQWVTEALLDRVNNESEADTENALMFSKKTKPTEERLISWDDILESIDPYKIWKNYTNLLPEIDRTRALILVMKESNRPIPTISIPIDSINITDLSRIKGIGVEYADLLAGVGVNTVQELALWNPDNLMMCLDKLNEDKRLVRKLPTKKMILDWINQAGILAKKNCLSVPTKV